MKHFIHVPKTGGTSLINDSSLNITYTNKEDLKQSTLQGIDEFLNKYRKLPFGWDSAEKVFAHARYMDIEKQRDSYFTVIRNPWDRMASRWLYSIECLEKYNIDYDIGSLDDFLTKKSLFRYEHPDFTWFTTIENWWDQLTYILNEKGEMVTDNIRFEYYEQDIERYLGKKPKHLRPSILKTKNYKEYYNSKTIQKVADIYHRDIEAFGFDFDTSSTKNYWS